jgi:hypothetical protein
MARSERVAPTPFGQFMASTAGRVTRGVVGIALIVAGLLVGGVGGWVLGGFGVVLLAAGLFDSTTSGLGARLGDGVAAERREPPSDLASRPRRRT